MGQNGFSILPDGEMTKGMWPKIDLWP
jgi:hypothetical protein